VSRWRALVDRALVRLSTIGADPDDDEATRLRKALLVLIALLLLPISLAWAALYLVFGGPSGYSALAYFAVSLASIVVFARTHDFRMLLRIQVTAILLAPTLSMIPLGGALAAGGVGIWGIMAPLGALVFGGVGAGVRWFAAFAAVFLASSLLGSVLGFAAPIPTWFSNLMLALNVTVGGAIVFTLLALFAQQREAALAALRVEQERAEGLLLNILPGSIAERLKSGPQLIADHFTVASVLFADVVDFTPRTEKMAPAEVVGLLDRLFSHFDGLAEGYGLEKIKTIGDAYMVASGIPTPRDDHATALAGLALDMEAAVAPGGAMGDLGMQLRIGINSGPVVAGVIGRRKFLYDLWGDAVNIASRMESHGTAGRIQISRETSELLQDDFYLVPRGKLDVKGKGEMLTWYLEGRKDSEPGSAAAREPRASTGTAATSTAT
jgi:guanylate cyclase